jgi:large subunit ribosomal protein L29
MAKEKIELNNLSDHDLANRIAESELRLKKLKFTHVVSPLENPLSIRALRREIAQLKTEQHSRELFPEKHQATAPTE